MCGISAIISNTPQDSNLVVSMNRLIRHRGPDGTGYSSLERHFLEDTTTHSKVLLGHQRLAILDLTEHGHQPMTDDYLTLIYNGEIYNYIELREELKTLGHIFRTATDTEVLLKAWKEWGQASLHRLNGMFAFIIVDNKNQSFTAVRDRFGVKPLYFTKIDSSTLAFASEIKQFTALPKWKPSLNLKTAHTYLSLGLTDHSDETLFASVQQLRGGQLLHCSLTNVENFYVHTWYQPTFTTSPLSFEEASEQFEQLLSSSVQMRMRSDVNVGSCLSGGLDSSSIVCLMKKLQVSPKTFSSCSNYKQFCERPFIEEVVRQKKLQPHYIYPNIGHLFDELDDLIWTQDEPFGSTSIYAQNKVFELAKQHDTTVILDGQGADEILAGYDGFYTERLLELLRHGHLITFMQEMKLTQLSRVVDRLLPNILRHVGRRILGKRSGRLPWLNIDDQHIKLSSHTSLNDYSLEQLTSSSLPMLLRYEDRNSMAYSIESRTPFLDYRLVEFCLSLPSSYKLSDNITKRVLRAGMKNTLPEKICSRKDKMGFVTPEQIWMQAHPELFIKKIHKTIKNSNGLIDISVLKEVEPIIRGQQAFNWLPWRLICFGKWMEIFL